MIANIVYLLTNLKNLETEVGAYRLLFHAVGQMEVISDLDAALQKAKHEVAKQMDQKYDMLSEKFRQIVDQGKMNQEVAEFLKSWNPEGQAN